MQGSFDDAVRSVAITMAINDGRDPHSPDEFYPGDIRTPAEIALHALPQGKPVDGTELVSAPAWQFYRFKAAMHLLGQKNGDYIALVERALTKNMGFTSHIGQDAWVAQIFNNRVGSGFFLDFGAFDGKQISNTYYLEKTLGWRGICVEPNPTFFAKLCAERSAICVNAALHKKSRTSMEFIDAHGLSSFKHLADSDQNAASREAASRGVIKVDTINPTELLERFNAPTTIDYMSLDVEGAELDVLKAFDFTKYRVTLLTVEHNSVEPKRQDVRDHLAKFGYAVEGHRNDDFFWLKDFGFPNDPAKVLERVAASYKIHAA